MQRMTKRGMQWLSAVAEDPELCRKYWADDLRRPYALPVGVAFEMVVTDQRLGVEVFDQLERRNMPVGPVMADRGSRQVGFFLPLKARDRFARLVGRETDTPPAYRYLDRGSHVVVPGPIPMADDRYQWLRAPNRRPESSPLRTASLAVMLVASAVLLERADHYGEHCADVQAVNGGPAEVGEQVVGRAE
ncbi:bifunctional DNA primase/polymerase [Streptomyces bomunensis]|uniref:Bifunctional DNA primase/polymerase n=1 Tax=Streptomyces montanisoli TaxID=2798581 RepID=A0A940M809_9ACTN|nr:bifunctional DNA primase/polymerase [Streptomyces montanisoli]